MSGSSREGPSSVAARGDPQRLRILIVPTLLLPDPIRRTQIVGCRLQGAHPPPAAAGR
jgi:hypothetical protein